MSRSEEDSDDDEDEEEGENKRSITNREKYIRTSLDYAALNNTVTRMKKKSRDRTLL